MISTLILTVLSLAAIVYVAIQVTDRNLQHAVKTVLSDYDVIIEE